MTGPALPGKRRGYGMAEATAKFKRGVAKPSSARGTRTERFAEVGYHFVPQHMVPSPISARVEENPQAKACRHTGFHIADLVTQDRTLCGIQSEIRDRQQDHARLGLAPRMIARVLADAMQRVIRAVVDAGDRRPQLQSDRTSIVSSPHGPSHRNSHGRCRIGC